MDKKIIYIPSELASAVKGGFVTSSKEIRDNNLNISQEELNRLIVQAGEDISHLSEIIQSQDQIGDTDFATDTDIVAIFDRIKNKE